MLKKNQTLQQTDDTWTSLAKKKKAIKHTAPTKNLAHQKYQVDFKRPVYDFFISIAQKKKKKKNGEKHIER